jgi:hypothetical protein
MIPNLSHTFTGPCNLTSLLVDASEQKNNYDEENKMGPNTFLPSWER